jgi:hypothetical protein
LDNDRKDKALEYLNKFVREIPDNPTLLALKAYIDVFVWLVFFI